LPVAALKFLGLDMNRNNESSVGMGHMVMRRAKMTPQDPALTYEGDTQTFEQLAQNIGKVAYFLKSLNIEPGDRVGYLGQNHPRFLEVLYASSLVGAIFVPLNYRLTSQEVQFIANDSGLKVLFADQFSAAPY
jgi:fatty-acyl-CoA synthase